MSAPAKPGRRRLRHPTTVAARVVRWALSASLLASAACQIEFVAPDTVSVDAFLAVRALLEHDGEACSSAVVTVVPGTEDGGTPREVPDATLLVDGAAQQPYQQDDAVMRYRVAPPCGEPRGAFEVVPPQVEGVEWPVSHARVPLVWRDGPRTKEVDRTQDVELALVRGDGAALPPWNLVSWLAVVWPAGETEPGERQVQVRRTGWPPSGIVVEAEDLAELPDGPLRARFELEAVASREWIRGAVELSLAGRVEWFLEPVEGG